MILSHEHKFIFLRTKKTAGTSIELALSELCGPLTSEIDASALPLASPKEKPGLSDVFYLARYRCGAAVGAGQ